MASKNPSSCSGVAKNVLDTHDHAGCVSHVHSAIEARALEGLRLTPARKEVLDILLESHAALGAYTILERLSATTGPKQPPIVYRALEYLASVGLVHKIEKLNAFVACTHPHGEHSPSFLVCTECRRVAEHHETGAERGFSKTAKEIGFEITDTVIEVLGICTACSAKGAKDARA